MNYENNSGRSVKLIQYTLEHNWSNNKMEIKRPIKIGDNEQLVTILHIYE